MCSGEDEIQKDSKLEFKEFNRSCTDILMLLLFIGAGIASIVILFQTFDYNSDPFRTLYGVDFQGNICGKSSGYEDLKYAAWPLPPTSTSIDANIYYRVKICVADCAETNQQSGPRAQWFTDQTLGFIGYESFKFFRYCIPKAATNTRNYSTGSETAARTIADLYVTWPIILISAAVALVFSFIYIKVMKIRCCRRVLVWGVILFTIAGGFLTGYALLRFADTATTTQIDMFNRSKAARIVGWVCIGVTVVYIFVIFFLRKRINLAISIIGATACAIDQMKSLIFYPLVPFIFTVGYVAYWIFMALHLFSVKDSYVLDLPNAYDSIVGFQSGNYTTYIGYAWNDRFQYIFIYHFFHLLWVTQFIEYAAYMTSAGAIGEWYFSLPNPNNTSERLVGYGEQYLSSTPVASSMKRTIFYHLGTVAFGSLIIAIIKFIRAVVTYIQRKTKDSQNGMVRCIFCCIQCCLKCCQKCVDYISRNALIWSAITGENFCSSGVSAFSLVLANLGRAAALNFIGGFVIFFGKICIALITAGGCGLVMQRLYDGELFSTVMPMVIIFILAYVVASLFMGVFDTSMDTMFLCYIADTEGKYTPNALSEALKEAQAIQAAAKGASVAPDAANGPNRSVVYVQQQPQPQGQPQPQMQTYAPAPQQGAPVYYQAPPPQQGGQPGYGAPY